MYRLKDICILLNHDYTEVMVLREKSCSKWSVAVNVKGFEIRSSFAEVHGAD